MFRQIAAISFILIFAANVFNRAVIVLDYYANTTAFARNCENKARPMLHCNGKCQMMKKLQEEEKKEQQNSERRDGSKTEIISSKSFFTSLAAAEANRSIIHSLQFPPSVSKGIASAIFHPPGLI